MKTKLFFCAIISSIFVSLFLASCGPSSTDLERKKQNDSIKPIAESIIKDVAVIKDTFVGNKDTKFIIFEELHTSIKGQIEIAIMLNRLYEKYKLRNIALEGLFSNKEFNTKWFHEMDTYKYPSLKNETAVQILSEGEISSAEFMSLVYSDLSVFGTENEKDYNVEISESASSAVYPYLFAIAEKSAGQDIIIVFNKLIKENKNKEAIETLLNSNPFTKEKYKLLSNQDTILSIEATIEIYENIKKEAEKVEAKIDAKTDKELNEAIEFDKTAARRSDTMVKYCIEKANSTKSKNIALTIGAAHTSGITKLFKEKGYSYAVITPNALKNRKNEKESEMSFKLYNRKISGKSVDTIGIGVILTGIRKPKPVVEYDWFKSKDELYLITALIARAVADGNGPPFSDEFRKILNKNPNIAIDYTSFSVIGNDVIFKVKAKSDLISKPDEIWVRTAKVIANPQEIKNIETLLKIALENIKKQNTLSKYEIFIGDQKEKYNMNDVNLKKSVKVVAVSQSDIAAFSRSKEAIKGTRLSI